MAFNPFAGFQKNKKFWMAAVLLLCMVTFIFCTGLKGDLADKILVLFSRNRGPTVVEVGSYRLTRFDLESLRSNRNMVNEYMRQCCEMTIANMQGILQKEKDKISPKGGKEQEKHLQELTKLRSQQMSLEERLRKPRFFPGGVKLDDLVEFKLWQIQADRLGIRLDDEHLDQLVRIEFFKTITNEQLAGAEMNARRGRDTGEANLKKALIEEYRVRIAQLAVLEMQPARYFYNLSEPLIDPNMPDQQRVHVTLAQIWNVYKQQRSEFDVTLIPIRVDDFTKEVFDAGPPAKAELEQFFDKWKNERYDLNSPLPSFESPKEIKVEFLMADPTTPMYLGAARTKLVMETLSPLVASPMQSPVVVASRYGAISAAKQTRMQELLDGLSQAKAWEHYGTAPLATSNFELSLATAIGAREPRAVASLLAAAPGSLGHPALMSAPAVTGFFGEAITRHGETLDAAIAADAKRRVNAYAAIAAAGAIGDPFGFAASSLNALKVQAHWTGYPGIDLSAKVEFAPPRMLLPLQVIERDLENVIIDRTAERWAMDNLLAVKKQLDNAKPETIRRIVDEIVVPENKLIRVVTSKLYNRYDIHKAPELKPLREAYEKYYPHINDLEQRELGPAEKKLKETDFYRLFFENEPFASGSKYQVRPWPPDVTPNPVHVLGIPGLPHQAKVAELPAPLLADVQRFLSKTDPKSGKRFALLDSSQKPILFWWRDEKPAVKPQTLSEAGERVIEAWKVEKARETRALPLAKTIAEKLVEQAGDFRSDLIRDAGRSAGHDPIALKKISPLVPKETGEQFRAGTRTYYPYALPKDTIPSPRDDTVANLLTLYDLKKAYDVKLNLKEGEPAFVKLLNDLNKALWDKVQKEPAKERPGHYVQVLTNNPQSMYYIVLIQPERRPHASPEDFKLVVADAFGLPERMMLEPSYVDTFVMQAQDLLAKDFHTRFLNALKDELGYTAPDEKQRSDFDGSDHGG